MNVVFKGLFDFFVSGLSVSENTLLNYFVLLIIGAVAYNISKSIVGSFYHEGFISGRSIGSLLHWSFRLILTLLMVLLFYLVIVMIKLVLSISWWTWLLALLLVAAIVVYILFKRNSVSTIDSE